MEESSRTFPSYASSSEFYSRENVMDLMDVSLTLSLEVDRAIDNLVKSGKMFGGPGRRDSGPAMGGSRAFPEFGKLFLVLPWRSSS